MGLITNIGQTHIEVLGSQAAIVRAKGELISCIPAAGRVFLNGDDPYSHELADLSAAKITWFGLGETGDVLASDIVIDEAGRPTMTLRAGEQEVRVSLGVPGRHNAYNAVAAAAVALCLGRSPELIARGLSTAIMTEMRMQVLTTPAGVSVVNDAYNANPTSMRAAVATLIEMRTSGRHVAVLGDMAELGSLTELTHFSLGEAVARSRVDCLVTVGERARRIADGALAAGMEFASVRPCASVEEASEVLDDLLEAGDVVLVKASRCMGLERIVEGMLNPHV
ncbi:MAG: UDP-N-acetylmuramoyl-tripeptide--D-alanyl-D-alanine ligase [bacterium]